MSHIEHYLSASKKPLELFASLQKNSTPLTISNAFVYTGYEIQDKDVKAFQALKTKPYTLVCKRTLAGEKPKYFLHLQKIEKTDFNPKKILNSLNSLIQSNPSSKLKDIFQSMKAHVELIRLAQTKGLEKDLQSKLQSFKKSTTDHSLTPFLNDSQNLIQFFPPHIAPSDNLNNPTLPKFLEINQSVLNEIQEGWNKNKHHQKQLLKYANQQITSLKKENQANAANKTQTASTRVSAQKAAPIVEKNRKTNHIPKILENPIAIASAILQVPVALVEAPINRAEAVVQRSLQFAPSSQPLRHLNSSPLASGMRNLAAAPLPGKPFPYKKHQRILNFENHPFGEILPVGVFGTKYQNYPSNIQDRIHRFHFLHPVMDRFLHLGIEGLREGKKHIDILTRVVYHEEIFIGVYGYTFDRDTCYHRCFTTKSSEALELSWEKLNAQQFPDLEIASKPRAKGIRYDDLKCHITEDRFGNTIIQSTGFKLKITIIKP